MFKASLAAAAASLAIATPALAAPTVTDTSGTPLEQQIFGIAGTGTTVFGSSPNNDGVANVTFTGDTTIQVGSGFAQINDPTPNTSPWFSLLIDPDVDFTDFKFSTMLQDQNGTISVFATLVGGTEALVGSYSAGIGNLNKLLSGGVFDSFRIESSSPIAFFEVKQLSFNAVTGAVPEPGTWAMMLLGFAGIGTAVRRSRRKNGALLQIA
jgi:hypothetical protein